MNDQPLCPRCSKNPTSMTVQVAEDAWQDVCASCGTEARRTGAEAIPIQPPPRPRAAPKIFKINIFKRLYTKLFS